MSVEYHANTRILDGSGSLKDPKFWVSRKCPLECGVPEDAVLIATGKTGKVYRTATHVYKITKKVVKPDKIYVDTYIGDDAVKITSGNDGFVTQTIVSDLIAYILDPKDMGDLFVRQTSAFIYKNHGYTVLEPIKHGNFTDWIQRPGLTHEMMDSNIIDCVYDVMSTLSILKRPEYNFVHADLKSNNVGVSEDLDGNIVYQILDFDKSSLTYKGIRWYNKSLLTMFIPPKDFEDTSEWYTLSDAYIKQLNNANIKSTVMYSREAFYMSYDVYILLYSIMRIRPVSVALFEDKLPGFYNILRSIFTLGDLVQLGRDILEIPAAKAHSLTAMNYDLGVRRIRLKKDINNLYKIMGLGNPDRLASSRAPER